MKKTLAFLIIFLCSTFMNYSYAEEGFTQKDRELLIELRVTMEEIDKRFYQIDKRFEQIDKRFEQIDKRFEQVDTRFAELRVDMNKRFEQMFTFLWIITGIFTSLTIVLISIVFWDRRTIIRKAKKETIEDIERKGLSTRLLEALRELSKEDKKLAEVLRQFHLL